jgi:hypothetical protein
VPWPAAGAAGVARALIEARADVNATLAPAGGRQRRRDGWTPLRCVAVGADLAGTAAAAGPAWQDGPSAGLLPRALHEGNASQARGSGSGSVLEQLMVVLAAEGGLLLRF